MNKHPDKRPPGYIPLEERWKHDIPYSREIGDANLTDEELEEAAKDLERLIELDKQGKLFDNDDDDLKD